VLEGNTIILHYLTKGNVVSLILYTQNPQLTQFHTYATWKKWNKKNRNISKSTPNFSLLPKSPVRCNSQKNIAGWYTGGGAVMLRPILYHYVGNWISTGLPCVNAYSWPCVCVCVYVCKYVCTFVCTHVCMHVLCMYVRMYVCMYICMYERMYVCMYICMYEVMSRAKFNSYACYSSFPFHPQLFYH